jgi:hypothetical protein
MPTIAISYRRSDTSALAGRIFDRLSAHYGEHEVFMDIDNIPFGVDFRSHIRETLQRTDVLIALIGADWLGRDAAGTARIRQEKDLVRVEIETALERKIRIIPVLIDGAKMPDDSELPATFGNFAFLNAAEMSSGRDFRTHMDRLVFAIDRILAPARSLSDIRRDFIAAKSMWDLERVQLEIDLFTDREPNNIDALQLRGKIQAAIKSEQTRSQAALHSTLATAKTEGAIVKASAKRLWTFDMLRYFLVPLVVLLVGHYAIVNSFNLNTNYLRLAAGLVPFAAGFAFFWVGGWGAGPAAAFALALGLVGVVGMSISESLYSGDPMLPRTRVEWLDNFQFAATISLSFVVGHVVARMLRGVMSRRLGKP